MEIATIELPRAEARRAYLDYRREIQAGQSRELDEVQSRQLEQDRVIAAGYRQLSIGRQLIRLSETIIAGGFDQNARPRLAIARCDTREVELDRWDRGRIRFRPWTGSPWDNRFRSASTLIEIDGPAYPTELVGTSHVEGLATVPPVPPAYRPKAHPRNYHILFEAEWRTKRSRRSRSSSDPALLKRLGGDLYAVLAVWDLTDVEKAALDAGIVQ